MKNTLFMVMMGLAGTVFAGQSVVTTAPQPTAVTPTWGVEVAGSYNFGLGQLLKKDNAFGKKNHMNLIGGDITGVYNLDENSAVTLRFGYGYGSDKFGMAYVTENETGLHDVNTTIRERLHAFTIMPGYRYTYAVNDSWSVFGGVNVGLAANSLKISDRVSIDRVSTLTADAHKSAWGFAWSLEAGAKYQLDTNWNVFAAVSYSGNTAKPSVRFNGVKIGKMKTPQYLGVRLGVGYSF